ncbi:hypothetical protein H4R33_007105, partial [Dimargaris cristalligena]
MPAGVAKRARKSNNQGETTEVFNTTPDGQRKEPQEPASRLTRSATMVTPMDKSIDDEVPPKKGRKAKFHLAAPIDQMDTDDVVKSHLRDGKLGISTMEYLAVAPRARKVVQTYLAKRRQYTAPEVTVADVHMATSSEDDSGDSEIEDCVRS